MQTPDIDINVSVEEFLNAKLKYHTDQIDIHKTQLEAIKKAIAALRIPQNTVTYATAKYKPVQAVMGATQDGFGIINQKSVKPIIEDYLKTHSGKHLTSEIFDAIKPKYNIPDELRKAWVGSISLSLHSLVTLTKPKVKKTNTDKESIKAYEWIGEE